MTSTSFDNLVKIGQLISEATNQQEILGLLTAGKARLKDASRDLLSDESRFDLAYNAAHSFALAALRNQGYRPKNRYVVFQALHHTLGLGPEVWRVLAKCHDKRNLAEYEGHWEMDTHLLNDLLGATEILQSRLSELLANID